MDISGVVFSRAGDAGHWKKAIWLLAGWTVVVLMLAAKHVVWRDEVRALSLALQGDSAVEMVWSIRDGHPGLWHLLLRGAYALFATYAVLPVVAFAVALPAVALLVFRSSFSLPIIALFLMGRAPIYEYSVMARNYGVSMLLMFAVAALYERHRHRGILIGVLLFLLANCNVHSALLAGAFMLFWLIDITCERSVRLSTAFGNFALNAAIVAAGVAICAATVYPTANDAAQLDRSGVTFALLAKAMTVPATSFDELTGSGRLEALLGPLSESFPALPQQALPQILMSVLLFGSTLGLIHRPAALVATWAALLGMSALFVVVYPGVYRHQALWLVFLMSMHWIAGSDKRPLAVTTATGIARTAGLAMLVALLTVQALSGLSIVMTIARGAAPESRSRDVAQLIVRTPQLANATIIADPDYLVEPLPYYVSNRTYLLRERRFGKTVVFTRNARLALSLDDILVEARSLRDATKQPVVILLRQRLDPSAPARTTKRSYNWQSSSTPEQVQAFLSATRRIESFPPACCTDESFDVYVLD